MILGYSFEIAVICLVNGKYVSIKKIRVFWVLVQIFLNKGPRIFEFPKWDNGEVIVFVTAALYVITIFGGLFFIRFLVVPGGRYNKIRCKSVLGINSGLFLGWGFLL